MKLKTIPDKSNIVGSQKKPNRNGTAVELANLIDTDFFDRIQEHWAEWKKMSRNGHMKLFTLNWKKYVAIIGKNEGIDKSNNITDMPDDIKAWYGAVLEWYRMISERIYNSYLPDKPPYEIAYPKALKYKHTDDADLVIIEWLNNLVSFEDINRYKVDIPSEHCKPINEFLYDWSNAIAELSQTTGIKKINKSKSKSRQFVVKMPYGDVVVEDDFWLRLNGNGAEEETLKNGGYLVGRKANEKPIVYFTDGLIAADMKPIK